MIVFSDIGFEKKDWHPTNLRICKRGEWNVRMLIETVLSMLTNVCHFKHSHHKVWEYFETKLRYTTALFNKGYRKKEEIGNEKAERAFL